MPLYAHKLDMQNYTNKIEYTKFSRSSIGADALNLIYIRLSNVLAVLMLFTFITKVNSTVFSVSQVSGCVMFCPQVLS